MGSVFFLSMMYFLRYGMFLVSYVAGQNKFPKPLGAAEERAAVTAARNGDKNAEERLVAHNLRLCAHIAKKYRKISGCDEDDLVSIGTIGLMKAVRSFNPARQARLSTYCARCIENEILMTIRAGKKYSKEVSLNECLGHDAEGNEVTFMDILSTDDGELAEKVGTDQQIQKAKEGIFKTLTPQEQNIILKRYGLAGEAQTQQQIAKSMHISRSYVSRIEKRALEKLHQYLEE